MPQTEQAVQEKAAATTHSMRGSRKVEFHFTKSADTTRTLNVSFNPPPGTQASTIALQGFDVKYSDHKNFDFGQLQISLSTSNTESACTASLRDDNVNKREWQGTVTGLVTFFG